MHLCRKTRRGARRPGGGVRLYVEPLELRSLPSTLPTTLPALEVPPNDTFDQAVILGALSPGNDLQAAGVIGDSPAGAADVDWYQFTLEQPLDVALRAANPAGSAPAPVVLSLYNSDPFNFTDPSMLLGTRLLAQARATADAVALIDQPLSAGTYYVAVSGAGNLSFHPFLAGSGYDGRTGPYTLLASATDLGLDPAVGGPVVLTSDPAPDAALATSPAYLHIDLGSALDTDTTPADQIAQLTFSPDGQFDGSEPALPLADVQYSPTTNEILVIPSGPLAPGYYNLSLLSPDGSGPSGDPGASPPDFTTPQPWQQNWSMTFQVAGVEGNAGPGAAADDTPGGAHEFGNLAQTGLVQATGFIGDDPTAPPRIKAAADVDLYHFQVSGPGSYALTAEAFAGRISSPLNPALSLFRLDPTTNQLVLVAANDDTLNTIATSDGLTIPLRKDAVLFAGLTAGDYYVAVSSSKNMPDPRQGIAPGQLLPGAGRIFDPNVSHSGTAGSTTGGYVLNLLVQQEQQPPRVLTSTPADGDTLNAPPTELRVTFSEPVNLQQLAYLSYQTAAQGGMPAFFVTGSDGSHYKLRFESFDSTTNTASLLMLDALPNGTYALHLAGAAGLADLSGNPLVGNDPSGDYVIHFTVSGAPRGTNGDPLTWSYTDSADAAVHEQSLGVLFPDELQASVTIVRQPVAGKARPERADAYDFVVLQQEQQYVFRLSGTGLPAGMTLALLDAAGSPVSVVSLQGGTLLQTDLQPGSYRLVVQGWTAAQSAGVSYQLTVTLRGSADSPVPLTSGPAPAIRLRLHETITPPPAPPASPGTPTNAGGGSTTTPGSTQSASSSSSGGASQSPPRLTLPVVEGSPDAPGMASTVPATWTGGEQPGAGGGRIVGPIPPEFVALGLVIKLPAASTGEQAISPAVRFSVPEGAGPAQAAGVPFNLLAVLGTSPTGNLGTNAADLIPAAPRMVLRLPEPAVADGLLRFILFTPLVTGGSEDEASGATISDDRGQGPAGTPGGHGKSQDFWFSRLGWLPRAVAGLPFIVPLQEHPGDADSEDELIDPAQENTAFDEAAAVEEKGWALALLGAVAGVGLERRQGAAREAFLAGQFAREGRA